VEQGGKRLELCGDVLRWQAALTRSKLRVESSHPLQVCAHQTCCIEDDVGECRPHVWQRRCKHGRPALVQVATVFGFQRSAHGGHKLWLLRNWQASDISESVTSWRRRRLCRGSGSTFCRLLFENDKGQYQP
jgi:hypothetical protein